MYPDPSQIRRHTVKLSLNDNEAALIDAVCNYSGQQKAALMREMVMRQVEKVLSHGNECAQPLPQVRHQ